MATEKPACGLDECDTGEYAKGYCRTHYQRWRRHGDPRKVLPKGGARARKPKPPVPTAAPAPGRHVFEAVWPITGPHNRVAPTADEAQGLCTVAMFEIHKIARGLGVEMVGAPKFTIIATASNPRAAAHPESAHCPYTLRATTRAARRQGATA